MKVFEYWKIRWRKDKPLCPKCYSSSVKRLRSYPVAETELYVDYKCVACGCEFTVNLS